MTSKVWSSLKYPFCPHQLNQPCANTFLAYSAEATLRNRPARLKSGAQDEIHRDLKIMAVARGRNREPGRTALASDASREALRPAASAIRSGSLSRLYSKTWSR